MSKGKKWSYLRDINSTSKEEVVSKKTILFHNGSGYRIIIQHDDDNVTRVWVNYKWSMFPAGHIYSGYPTDNVVGCCIEDLPRLLVVIRDKITRRFFLKTIRELPMHDGLYIKDFLTNNGKGDRIDWKKVREYEEKYYTKD